MGASFLQSLIFFYINFFYLENNLYQYIKEEEEEGKKILVLFIYLSPRFGTFLPGRTSNQTIIKWFQILLDNLKNQLFKISWKTIQFLCECFRFSSVDNRVGEGWNSLGFATIDYRVSVPWKNDSIASGSWSESQNHSRVDAILHTLSLFFYIYWNDYLLIEFSYYITKDSLTFLFLLI